MIPDKRYIKYLSERMKTYTSTRDFLVNFRRYDDDILTIQLDGADYDFYYTDFIRLANKGIFEMYSELRKLVPNLEKHI